MTVSRIAKGAPTFLSMANLHRLVIDTVLGHWVRESGCYLAVIWCTHSTIAMKHRVLHQNLCLQILIHERNTTTSAGVVGPGTVARRFGRNFNLAARSHDSAAESLKTYYWGELPALHDLPSRPDPRFPYTISYTSLTGEQCLQAFEYTGPFSADDPS